MAKKKRGTGSGKRSHRASTKITKTHRRAISLSRGDDLVWQDMQHSLKGESTNSNKIENGMSHMYGVDSVRDRKIGAVDDAGLVRSSNQPLDDDLPGSGQYYCVCCARYFTDETSLSGHRKTKAHKKRLKELGTKDSVRPHTQLDAELAAGMGKPDNGKRLRTMELE